LLLQVYFLLLNIFFKSKSDISVNQNKNISFNDSINYENKSFALKNQYGFTDFNRTKKKPNGIFRIVVLGDSFIWGDGLPYEKVWSHKLEKLLSQKYDSTEVIHWGKNGWSTKDQLNFLDTAGFQFEYDLLILGWVNNDPDMGDYTHMNYNYRHTFRWFYMMFPSLAAKILDKLYAISYQNWLNKLYSEKNLSKYELLLDSLRNKVTFNGKSFFAVLTPSCIFPSCHVEYEKIKPVFKKLNIETIDVYDAAVEKLSFVSSEKLRANPENHHPGDLMTTVFAEEVFIYIENHFSERLKPKK
jgi:hypothetical protein